METHNHDVTNAVNHFSTKIKSTIFFCTSSYNYTYNYTTAILNRSLGLHGPVITLRAPLKTAKREETAASRTKAVSPNEASPLTNLQSALPPMPASTWTPNKMPERCAGERVPKFRVLSLSRGYRRLHSPELFNFCHRYRSILFNSLDSINYTVRLHSSLLSLSHSRPTLSLPSSLSPNLCPSVSSCSTTPS